MAQLPRIDLHREALRRVSRGHRWIFSNEIAKRDPALVDGGECAVFAASGEFLGSALHSAHALIAARIYSRAGVAMDRPYLVEALLQARSFRERFAGGRTSLRLVHGDADGLPGLILDRFGGHIVMQLLTAGMEARRDLLIDLIREHLLPESLIDRSDSAARAYEQLPERAEVVFGDPPARARVEFGDVAMLVDLRGGQKTGLFLDQSENWDLARRFGRDARVLDLFCHAGGWSLHALRGGAAHVTAVDSSAAALADVRDGARLNGFDPSRLATVEADVFAHLRSLSGEFELVICDPPAFAKSRKSREVALRGYADVNRLAMRHLAPGGILVACSCSHHVGREDFLEALRMAARDARRQFRILPERAGPPADHAPLLSTPETDYLKMIVLVDQPDAGVELRRRNKEP